MELTNFFAQLGDQVNKTCKANYLCNIQFGSPEQERKKNGSFKKDAG